MQPDGEAGLPQQVPVRGVRVEFYMRQPTARGELQAHSGGDEAADDQDPAQNGAWREKTLQ